MAKQSRLDRMERLKDGRCPIHGIPMYQKDLEYKQMSCGHYHPGRAIVGCSRNDCDIRAYEEKPFEDAELFPEFLYLIA
jgi:hypothetical protein